MAGPGELSDAERPELEKTRSGAVGIRNLGGYGHPSPMSAFSSAPVPFLLASLRHAALGALLATFGAACGSDDDEHGSPATAGASAAGATAATGAGAGTGVGGSVNLGGTGGTPSVVGGGGTKAGGGGSSSQAGRSAATGGGAGTGGSNARGGGAGVSGSASATAAGGPSGPPAPNDDGSSPYERECHGDTVECVDVQALRCLGIRDDSGIHGYSCSNTCESDADCSTAPASGEATAACVDFVTQKHCLLVCLSGGAMRSCPDGMSCYVYPQSPIGYCLWQ